MDNLLPTEPGRVEGSHGRTLSTDVAFAHCNGYDPSMLSAALDRVLAPLGGITAFVRSGCRVLVKPNLLTDRPPEAAVTTHPELVRQVIRRLKAAGAVVVVADSPAFVTRVEQVWRVTGIQAVCAEESVPLLCMEAAPLTTLSRDGYTFSVSNLALHADLIVNLPKVKSHSLTVLTAAVKNFYGVIPGHLKTELHKTHARPERFGGLVQAICRSMPASLTIADGVLAMEGDGPSSGTPVSLNFLAASADPFALDLALCDVLRIDPEQVPYLVGLSHTPDYTARVRYGECPDVARFRLPRNTSRLVLNLLPGWLVRRIGKLIWFRPTFGSACVRCGKCVTACPVHAIALRPRGVPILNGPACIGCCCCHEVCPAHVITIRPSPIVRLERRVARAFAMPTQDDA
jgi:uncharacterized protein (DUF362 family)/Pyruvate/2-oxoacid:ferredoxin oxidoreductase delta subunit